MTFNNDRSTNEQRVTYMETKGAYVENHGTDDDPNWILFYGGSKSLNLDAQTWEDAIFEACGII